MFVRVTYGCELLGCNEKGDTDGCECQVVMRRELLMVVSVRCNEKGNTDGCECQML